MRTGESYDEGGVTYIGPRALLVGFMLYCVGFMALIYGANWISGTLEPREPVAASVTVPLSPAATAQPPVRPAVQAPPRAHAAAPALICAPAPPCTVRPGRTPGPAIKPATKPATKPAARTVVAPPRASAGVRAAHPAGPRPIAAPPLRAVPATQSAPAVPAVPRTQKRARPAASPQRSATPHVQSLSTPAARARQTPAALLVPFTSASGLTSNSGLDPRAGSHAPPLMVGPTRGLGPNPAATPFGGTGPSRVQLR